jgi:serine/threonine-protein kinase
MGPVSAVVYVAVWAAVVIVARHNWVVGRVDRSGAWRIGLAFLITPIVGISLIVWDVAALFHLVLGYGMAQAIAGAVQAAVLYLALEPWARRHWPETMVTWSRVLAGRWRDPVVGRDVLIGLVGAVAVSIAHALLYVWIIEAGGAPAGVALSANLEGAGAGGFGFTLVNLMGGRHSVGAMLLALLTGLSNSLSLFFVLFLLRVLLKKPWIAVVATAALLGVSGWVRFLLGQSEPEALFTLFVLAVLTAASTRYGVFALAVWVWVGQFVEHAMLTPNFGAWYGQSSLTAVIVVSATALWACYTAVGGRLAFNVATASR